MNVMKVIVSLAAMAAVAYAANDTDVGADDVKDAKDAGWTDE